MDYNFFSSNLSPLAPPFIVDRSTVPKPRPSPNPLAELTEPPVYPPPLNPSFHNWVNTHQPIPRPDNFPTSNPEFDPLLAPNSSTCYVPNGSPSRFEVNPYYRPYVSSSVGDVGSEHSGYHLLSNSDVVTSTGSFHDDYLHSFSGLDSVGPQWVGLWGERPANWPQSQSNQVLPDGSFCPKESGSNQGFYSCGGLSMHKEDSIIIGVEKHVESSSSRVLDPKFFGYSKFVSPDFSSTPTLASTSGSAIPRTHIHVPDGVNFEDLEALFNDSNEQCFSNFDTCMSGSSLCIESSPAVVSAPPLHDTGTFSNVKSGDGETTKGSCGRNSPFVKESYPYISSGGKNYFDDSKLKYHLEATAHDFADFVSGKNEMLPSRNGASKDVSNGFSSEQCSFQVSQINQDDFSLNVDGPKVLDCLETHSWNGDHHNPAGDSPCWKGAPSSRLTPFELSEAANPWGIGKVEDAISPCMQGQDIFTLMANGSVKVSTRVPSESSQLYDNSGQESIVFSPSKRPLVTDLFHEGGIDGSVNCELNYENLSGFPNVTHKLKDESATSDKFTRYSDKKGPKTKEHGLVGELIFEKPVEPEVANADSMICGNCNPIGCTYNVSSSSAGHVYSESLSQDAQSKIIESHHGESRPQISVQMLVNTIHNLSELLLFHCSNDTCELNEEDRVTLKSVIKNIGACVPNKVERLASTQESLVRQSATSLVESSPELQKGPLENQHVQECERDAVSRRKEENLFEDVFSRTAVDMFEEENRTQAIKKILAEHFKTEGQTEDTLLYKNLWLEAEALLCSVNYMARFNRMKNEIEQSSKGKSTGEQPSFQISSSPQINNPLVANTIIAPISHTSFPDSTILKATNSNDATADVDVNSVTTAALGDFSSSNAFLDLNKDEKLEHEAKDNLRTEIPINDLPISSSTCHAADNEASVMARFQILKNQSEESNFVNNPTLDKISTSMEIPDLNNDSQWADEIQDDAKGDAAIKPLLTSATSSPTSYAEASVSANFQVLKQQDNKTVPHNPEEHHLRDECYGYVDQRSDWLINDDGSEARMINRMISGKVGHSENVTDLGWVGQSIKNVKQAAGTYASKKHLQMSSIHGLADDVDTSVISRFHILKSQYDNSSPHEKELKLCDDNCGIAVWRRNRLTGGDGCKDKMVDGKVQSEQQNHAASSTDGKVTYKEFDLFIKGGPVNQHGSTRGNADKSDGDWYDNFSSDWEHVMKEDFAAHKV